MHEHKRKHFGADFMESEFDDVDGHRSPNTSVIIGAVAAGVAGVGLAVVSPDTGPALALCAHY